MELRVEKVTLFRVRIPFLEPFRISTAEARVKECVLVRVVTSVGVGWGEASAMPGAFYSPQTPDDCWDDLARRLTPAVLAAGPIAPADAAVLLDEVCNNPFAKAGLEGALWHAAAVGRSEPLYVLLGGRGRPVESGAALGICEDLDELSARVAAFVEQGYRRIKIKIKPGWDVEPVAHIRRRWPHVPLMVDANAAYTLDEAEVFRRLDRMGLVMIEQPLPADAYDDLARLQAELATPICLDESADSVASLETAAGKGAGRIVNIKIQRVGGLAASLRMREVAKRAGMTCWVGTMPELGIGSAQAVHLATLSDFAYPTDVESSDRWFADDVLEPPITIDAAGYLHIPDGPGLGYRVSPEKIRKYLIRQEDFER